MSYISYSIILGIVIKIYDEIIDLQLNVDNVILESLKNLIVLFTVLLSYNDFPLSIALLTLVLLNPGIDTSFWKGMLPVTIIMSIISYSGSFNVLGSFILLSLLSLCAYCEDKLFNDEVSYEKLFGRVFSLFVLIGAFTHDINGYLSNALPSLFSNTNITEVGLYCIFGYILISIISQSYHLFFYKDMSIEDLNKKLVSYKSDSSDKSYFIIIKDYIKSIIKSIY